MPRLGEEVLEWLGASIMILIIAFFGISLINSLKWAKYSGEAIMRTVEVCEQNGGVDHIVSFNAELLTVCNNGAEFTTSTEWEAEKSVDK